VAGVADRRAERRGQAERQVTRALADYPSGKQGDALVVEFTVCGVACIGLNGGPIFPHTEAFSFQIATEDQAETDRYWNAIFGYGGRESECRWCRDKWGVNLQITPRVLTEAMAQGGEVAKRAFAAMMTMRKIDWGRLSARGGGDLGGDLRRSLHRLWEDLTETSQGCSCFPLFLELA
jgi:predicted 3-demethylubiquinone-9 3-methyltransferase (glyoxalase superfamily)